ncbi:hypothetical protein B9479_005547 [Cryptococcus floricola]|uniref:TauD/TfdA-like domain-containing protein n=1 Tax=Cryptococcus floricola TaxID=2591691 RepID=A0A5D3AQE2_9TREE|nr:hypothetical protein B9479_005547 [Cryptococcus floricola]
MAPIAVDAPAQPATAGKPVTDDDITALKARLQSTDLSKEKAELVLPPDNTLKRYLKAGIDLSNGYPYFPPKPDFVQDVFEADSKLEKAGWVYEDPGLRADKEKKALFGAAKEVRDLTKWIGTEIVGLQLKDLTDQQKDELALLVAERNVVFFRDQDLAPQTQQALGLHFGHGQIERHPQAAQVPGIGGGVSLIWEKGRKDGLHAGKSHRVPYPGGGFGWHTDLVHLPFPPGYTHLHQDTIPAVGGDTLWASGYAAYDKLSPKFKTLIDGLNGIYRSAHKYKDSANPDADSKYVTRVHPLVRTHPVTGWKALWINRGMTLAIEGLDKPESDILLNYLHGVFERSTDIQVRWNWTPGTSAIWDNRSTIHTVSYDYDGERHGTRVSSLGEKPFFDPASKSKAEALGLSGWVDGKDWGGY